MRDKVLTQLFKSKEFNDCISKMRPEYLQDDLKGEVMLVLCEMEESKLIDLHTKGVLRFYAVKTILNMIKSTTSEFYKKYRAHSLDLTSVKNVADIDNKLTDEATPISKKGKKTLEEIIESSITENTEEYQARIFEEKKNELRLMEVFNLFWYDKEMILLYLEHGNYRAIQKETKIHHVSAYNSIKKAIKQIDEIVDLRILKKQPYSPTEIIEYISRCDRSLAIGYLNNVLEYFKESYSVELLAEFHLRIQEKEFKFQQKVA